LNVLAAARIVDAQTSRPPAAGKLVRAEMTTEQNENLFGATQYAR